MRNFSTRKFIGVCAIFFALPFLINFLSCFDAPFQIWEQPSEWTKFWGQYISGFVAFAMLYVAWRTLLTSKESTRPFIVFDMVDCGASHAYLRCRNIGHSTAANISIKIDQSFIDKIQLDEVRQVFNDINNNRKFVLEPNGKVIWDIFCIPSMWLRMRSESRFGNEISYEFRGQRILEAKWNDNEKFFQTNTFNVNVSYNDYTDSFTVDYNNILEDIEPAKRIADQLFSVTWNLSEIKESLKTIKEKLNGAKQDK